MPASLGTFSQTRTTEAANEVTGTSGGGFAGTDYDAAGNQTAGPKTGAESTQIGYVYDGWNRLVGVDANHDGDLYDAGDVRYRYDGTGRRITKFTDNVDDGTNASGSTEEYYQNEQNQVLEVRTGTVTGGVKTINANPKERYLWDANYIDEPAMVELDTNTDGTRDYRLWPTTDANHNVTGLLSDKGVTVERYAYTPYGERIVLNGDQNYANTGPDADGTEYTVDTNGSDFGFLLGFQGLRMDVETGNWYARARYESPAQGTWTQRDPLGTTGYATQGMNLYQLEWGNPSVFTDPTGKDVAITGAPGHAGVTVQVWKTECKTGKSVLAGTFHVDYHAKGYMGTRGQHADGNVVTGTEGQIDWEYRPGDGHLPTIAPRIIPGSIDNDNRLLEILKQATGMQDDLGSPFSLPQLGPLGQMIERGAAGVGTADGKGPWKSYNVRDCNCYTFSAKMIDAWSGDGSEINDGHALWTFDGLIGEVDKKYPGGTKGPVSPPSTQPSSGR